MIVAVRFAAVLLALIRVMEASEGPRVILEFVALSHAV